VVALAGRDLKAEAVRAGVPLYRLAAEAGINPSELSRLLNEHKPLSERDRGRISAAIERLSGAEPAPAA
jgi:DNA-binding LacI/PurR family transcriptional regulator